MTRIKEWLDAKKADLSARYYRSRSRDTLSPASSVQTEITFTGTRASTASLPVSETKETTDENTERGNWSGKLDFLLSCIGYAVGLGNVWRFPYLCYKNGGGAFLIPYVITLLLAGLPLFFMELALGQFASVGPITLWRNLCPLFSGLGYVMVTVSAIVAIYYNVIIMYTIYYFFASFTSELPWSHCNNTWNTPACGTKRGNSSLSTVFLTTAQTTVNVTAQFLGMNNSQQVGNESVTWSTETPMREDFTDAVRLRSPSEEYWERYVLDISSGIDDMGQVRWPLFFCLLFAWVIIFLCLIKGVKSTGKVVYFTATFPYVVLLILFIRGVTLPGSADGIWFYVNPKFQCLKSAQVWGDAAVQIFYSLGPGWGGLLTMASYNKFHNNCYRDAIIVAFTNCGTSVFAGFVIFSVVGFMAHEAGVPVEDAIASGPGLAFVAYPEGIARMPGAPFWSVIFFFMLFTLGLDSQFAMMECIISACIDEMPRNLRVYKTYFTLALCIIMFFLGIPLVFQGGIYVLTLMDWYSAGFSLMLVTFLEIVIIVYIYGFDRFVGDINAMIGFRVNIYWKMTWKIFTPLTLPLILVASLSQQSPVTYNEYTYPYWSHGLGLFISIISSAWIAILAFVTWARYIERPSNLFWLLRCPWTNETLKNLLYRTDAWRPALPEHYRFKDIAIQVDMDNDDINLDFTYGYDNMSFQADAVYESYI